MSVQVFGICFLLGSGAVAIWVDQRFPEMAPPELRRAVLRTIIALAASQVLFPPVWEAALARGPVLVAVFSLAFPVLTGLLLCAIWSMRQLQATMRNPY